MRRNALLAFAAVATLIAVLGARPHATPGPFLRDAEAYWSAGATHDRGGDAYGRAIWHAEREIPGVDARRNEVLPFAGPPQALALWTLMARLPYALAARLWYAVLLAALALLAALSLRAAGAWHGATSYAAAIVLAVAFGPVTSDLALGQIALLAFAGAMSVTAIVDRRPLGAVLGALAASLQPNVALGLITQLGRARVTAVLATGGVAAYAIGATVAGPAWPLSYARMLAAHASAERFSAIQFTPAAVLYGLGASPTIANAAGIAFAILALAGALLLMRSVPDGRARFAACSTLAPFVAGFFHEHDLIVAYPAALWCAVRTRGVARAAALAGTLLVAVDWLGLAQRPSGIVQSALLGAGAIAAFACLNEEKAFERASLAAIATLALLFALGAWLAVVHPAPVWPDALGALYAPPSASIAQIWAAEQRASGLLAAVPAWSLLRVLPLTGCALLAAVIYRRSAFRRTA